AAPAILGVDEPTNAADEPKRAAIPVMKRGVGDDARAIDRDERKGRLIVDLGRPALDEVPVRHVVPGQPPELHGLPLEKSPERGAVMLRETTNQNSGPVLEPDLDRKRIRHCACFLTNVCVPPSDVST